MATQLDLAEAQLLGWHAGKHGESLIMLVSSMGLGESEWEKIKILYPSTLNESEKEEVDGYFRKQKQSLSPDGIISGGLDKYFKDLEKYESTLYCSECGADDNKVFNYRRTTSNSEVWWCDNCKREETLSKRPNEDKY